MRLRFFCVLCLSTTCLSGSAAPAQTSSEWIIARMGGAVRADVTWEQLRSNMVTAFYQSNPDQRGVTPQGLDNLRRSVMAQRRAQAAAQILNYDLDGDGTVSKDEITAVMEPRARQMIHANGVQLEPTPQQVRLQLDKLVTDALKPDSDRDGDQFVQLETNLLRGGLKLHAIGVDHLSRPRLHHGRNLVLANGSVAVQVIIQNLRGGLRTPLGHDASAQIVETLRVTPR